MDIHKNARLTPWSREQLVNRVKQQGWSVAKASAAAGVSERTGWKWFSRLAESGTDGLIDRSSRPRRSRGTRVSVKRKMIRLRRARLTCRKIAEMVGSSRATVARVLKGAGLARLPSLDEPLPPVQRYEYPTPGGLLHLDTKKLAKIHGLGHRITKNRGQRTRRAGYEVVHVCIDDHSRMSYVEILADEQGETAAAFLTRALSWFRAREVTVRRVLTDNGPCYLSAPFVQLCSDQGIRRLRTRPYTPRTNGKAERFIQTLLREWAYRYPFRSSLERLHVLSSYVHFYNHHRRHSALSDKPPITRIPMNNVLRRDS